MLTIQALQDLGVNTKEGLARCLNKEEFYFRLISKSMKEDSFEKLKEAVEANDLDKAFELAHALKGVTGNLSLTPLYDTIAEMTELLRARKQVDYTPYVKAMMENVDALRLLCD